MSESGETHFGHVLHRWGDILKHLKRQEREFPELTDFLKVPTRSDGKDGGAFALRYQRQIIDIHIAAYHLLPLKHDADLSPVNERRIYNLFRRYTSSDEEYATITAQFEDFRAQDGDFDSERVCWDHKKTPRVFWNNMKGHAKLLGIFAKRMYSTPANSVASERAFSMQNILHTKSRNALLSERVNKLTYAYMNARVLRNVEGGTATSRNMSSVFLNKAELMEFENEVLITEEENEIEGDEELNEQEDVDDDMFIDG